MSKYIYSSISWQKRIKKICYCFVHKTHIKRVSFLLIYLLFFLHIWAIKLMENKDTIEYKRIETMRVEYVGNKQIVLVIHIEQFVPYLTEAWHYQWSKLNNKKLWISQRARFSNRKIDVIEKSSIPKFVHLAASKVIFI